MRIAHATDIHWLDWPTVRQLSPKRVLGTANLWRKRAKEYDRSVQAALVRDIAALRPDVFLCTGDLTGQALATEFEAARTALAPVLDAVPSLVLPGNHDVYTRGAARSERLAQWFGPWMHQDGPLARLRVPGLTILGLNPNRPHLTASGVVPAAQLDALPAALEAALPDDAVILALHYPIVGRHGPLYTDWEHGLRNATDLVAAVSRSARRPDLIVHGHVHHGYRATLTLPDGTAIPQFDPGSGGHRFDAARDRAACFNVYEVDNGRLVRVERYRHDGVAFAPEAGGAYATGR